MVVVVLERGIVRHRIMVVEIGHREMVGDSATWEWEWRNAAAWEWKRWNAAAWKWERRHSSSWQW